MHEALTAAWERTVEQWDDPAPHAALLGLAAQRGDFAWVAGRYKERAGDPIADKQLEQIRKAVTATMFATATKKSADEASPYRKTLIWLVVLVAMLVLGLVFTSIIHDKAPKTRPAPAGNPTPARR